MRSNEPVNRLMMATVVSIDAREPAGHAFQLFKDYTLHHLPVVDQGQVIGVLGTADLVRLKATIPRTITNPIEWLNERMQVKALVRRPAITVGEHEAVGHACEIMAQHGVHALPVVNAQGHLVGMISSDDVLAAVFEHHAARPDVKASDTDRAAKLSSNEFDTVLADARKVVQSGSDTTGFAAALLHAQHLLHQQEQVLRLTRRYLNDGQDVHLHSELTRAITQVRGASGRHEALGLSVA